MSKAVTFPKIVIIIGVHGQYLRIVDSQTTTA